MRTTRLARLVLAVTAGLSALTTAGCATVTDPMPGAVDDQGGARAPFPTGEVFDYQLGGPYTPPPGVGLVVRDRTAPPAADLYSVCYVNAFQTQPGEQGRWPKETLLTVGEETVIDPDWPDEMLLDTSTTNGRDAIVEVVAPWIRGCADAGFEAVEFDNLDSFTRSHGALTLDDNLSLAATLAGIAHETGLIVGQKNSAEYARDLRARAGFDFAVAEECAAYDECAAYTDVYGEAVIDIEYADALPRPFAEMCDDPASPDAMILRDRDLVTPDDDAYIFQTCTR